MKRIITLLGVLLMAVIVSPNLAKAEGDSPCTVTFPSGTYGEITIEYPYDVANCKTTNNLIEAVLYGCNREDFSISDSDAEMLNEANLVGITDVTDDDGNVVETLPVAGTELVMNLNRSCEYTYVKLVYNVYDLNGNLVGTYEVSKELSEDKVIPKVLSVSYEKSSSKGYYTLLVSAETGADLDFSSITAYRIYSSDGTLLTEESTDTVDDYNEFGAKTYVAKEGDTFYTVEIPHIIGGTSYKIAVKNNYDNWSDMYTVDVLKNLKVDDDSTSKDKASSTKSSSLTLKVSSKKKDNTGTYVIAKTNRKCSIYLDGVYLGKTKSNKYKVYLEYQGSHTIRAIDTKGNAKEKKVSLKSGKQKAETVSVVSREDAWSWSDSTENNGELPQTGTPTLPIFLSIGGVLIIGGVLLILKKKGVLHR